MNTFRLEWDRWFLLIAIAICIGLLASFLKQCLQLFNNLRWETAKDFAAVSCTYIYSYTT